MLFSFPLAVIDFEATALTPQSYPIEAGVAIIAEPGAQIETWSTLIKPDPSWDIETQWDPDAERIHGISRWALREGLAPQAVMTELNARILAGATVWCDGGHHDVRWLRSVSEAAAIEPSFTLRDLGSILRHNKSLFAVFSSYLARIAQPHRAGPDALRLSAALHAVLTETI